jgi:hypothetical protein
MFCSPRKGPHGKARVETAAPLPGLARARPASSGSFFEQTLVISARDDAIESIAGKLDRTMHKDIPL